MYNKKRFLILTSDCGFGHRSAANSIEKALELQHPLEVTTTVVNPIFVQAAPSILKSTELNYDQTVTNNLAWYRFTYDISDSRPASALVESTLTLALYHNMRQLIRETRPDVILNTNQTFNAPAGVAVRSFKHRLPLYTAVTDLADVHSLWFNAMPDRFYIGSELVRQKARASGIPARKIFMSGIPVDPGFGMCRQPRSEIRTRLGLDPDLTTILVVGSKRVSGILEYLAALQKLTHPFQVAVIAGGDQLLYDKCQEKNWNFPIQVAYYVDNMPEWMLAADVLVTKAGGLVLSEGLAAGLPIVLIDHLPGQEEGNQRFILAQNAGAKVDTPQEFFALLGSWLCEEGKLLKQIGQNSRRLGRPDSALIIAEAMWQAAVRRSESLPRDGLRAWSRIE